MARPREFDTDEAIEKAMNVFWQHGYEAASLPDLLSGMGLTRGSLYKAFKDKKSLFLTVLKRYENDTVAAAEALLTNDDIPDGWERILRLFASISRDIENADLRGCLLCSTAAGSAACDTDIAEAVNRSMLKMRSGFATAVVAARHHRGTSDKAAGDLPDLLVSQYVGLRILSRSALHQPIIRQGIAGLRTLDRLLVD